MLSKLSTTSGCDQCRPAPLHSAITGVHGREIIDSRGNPTVEVDITTVGNVYRVIPLRCLDRHLRSASNSAMVDVGTWARGVLGAVKNVFRGCRAGAWMRADQRAIDEASDCVGWNSQQGQPCQPILGSKCSSKRYLILILVLLLLRLFCL
jgi:hypothetical protein